MPRATTRTGTKAVAKPSKVKKTSETKQTNAPMPIPDGDNFYSSSARPRPDIFIRNNLNLNGIILDSHEITNETKNEKDKDEKDKNNKDETREENVDDRYNPQVSGSSKNGKHVSHVEHLALLTDPNRKETEKETKHVNKPNLTFENGEDNVDDRYNPEVLGSTINGYTSKNKRNVQHKNLTTLSSLLAKGASQETKENRPITNVNKNNKTKDEIRNDEPLRGLKKHQSQKNGINSNIYSSDNDNSIINSDGEEKRTVVDITSNSNNKNKDENNKNKDENNKNKNEKKNTKKSKTGFQSHHRRSVIARDFKEPLPVSNMSMDDICKNKGSGMELQIQQKFLQHYVRTYRNWDRLLLFHAIGSGKTCAAIAVAEQLLALDRSYRVVVILPAAIQVNFINSLLNDCIQPKKYVMLPSDKNDKKNEKDPTIRIHLDGSKENLAKGMTDPLFRIFSFHQFAKEKDRENMSLLTWVKKFTKKTLIIVDEVHDIISTDDHKAGMEYLLENDMFPSGKMKAKKSMLLKYVSAKADPTCKMLFLSATPVFSKITEVREIVSLLNPEARPYEYKTVEDSINDLRGRISYFPGTSSNAFPKHRIKEVVVPMSEKQADELIKIRSRSRSLDKTLDKYSDDYINAFLVGERKACLSIYSFYDKKIDTKKEKATSKDHHLRRNRDNQPGTTLMDLENPENFSSEKLAVYAPKIAQLLKLLDEVKGKHMVYTEFVDYGTRLVTKALEKHGWTNMNTTSSEVALPANSKVFAVWDSKMNQDQKSAILKAVNATNNVDGKKLRVIVGSPSLKQGISLDHIQAVHMLSPVWSQSAMDQITGRAIRYCSHYLVDEAKYPHLRRSVDIYMYKLKAGKFEKKAWPKNDHRTVDERIYEEILFKKKKTIDNVRHIFQQVAIDSKVFGSLSQPDDTTTNNDYKVISYAGPYPAPSGVKVLQHSLVDMTMDEVQSRKPQPIFKKRARQQGKPDSKNNLPNKQPKIGKPKRVRRRIS
jgi:Helicase conserved C-terminal domain/Type III restriction enzyme, res subunit